jgi:hypothetical protein
MPAKTPATKKKLPPVLPPVSEALNIEFQVFDPPQKTVRGFVIATDTIKGDSRRVAHAHLLVGEASTITLDTFRGKFTPDELLRRAEVFALFANKVKALDATA